MIIDLIDKLVDRCIQLVKEKKEISKSLLSDFVEPAYAQFDEVHKNYLETFRAYRDSLKGRNSSLPVLIDKIKEDNLFSDNQRSKLWSLAELCKDPLLGSFVQAIYEYLTNPYDFIPDRNGVKERHTASQRWRTTLLGTLEMIDPKKPNSKETAIANLDMIVAQMQDLYATVTSKYMEVRQKLLK
jgi:hypothetical protein